MSISLSKPTSDINFNEHITDIFSQLCDHINKEYAISGDKKHRFRLMQIQKASKTISKLSFKVTAVKQIANLDGIGEGIQRRVAEILKSGTLAELEGSSEIACKIASLMKVHGIGLITARKFYYEHGIDSPEKLEEAITAGKLSVPDSIRISLKYRNHLSKRILRSDIDEIQNYLREQICAPFVICGSYRRGSPDSGDIDVLLNQKEIPSLVDLIKKLTKCGFLVAHLTTSNTHKYMGICKSPTKEAYYRIDFMLAPEEEYIPSLLHFTGSDTFNRAIRFVAIKKGLKLTERGLFRQDGTILDHEIKAEEDIFRLLDVKYLEPHERDL